MDSRSTEQQQGTKSFGWLRWCLAFALVLLIYILGIGPANRLGAEGIIPLSFVDTIYLPLESFCLAHRPTAKILRGYLKLWGIDLFLSNGQQIDDPVR